VSGESVACRPGRDHAGNLSDRVVRLAAAVRRTGGPPAGAWAALHAAPRAAPPHGTPRNGATRPPPGRRRSLGWWA